MQSPKFLSACILVMLASLLLAGCAARPELLPKSAIVPAGIDLSGLWELRIDPGAGGRSTEAPEQLIRIPPSTSSRAQVGLAGANRDLSRRAAVSVFLEFGGSLKISQTASGLFISFDRAVVEEYRFGENRLISVGPIEAQRVSGWEGGRFVNETLDDDGAILVDAWELTDDGKVLVRTIAVTKGGRRILSSQQRFDRR
jgi:hypothetical protein